MTRSDAGFSVYVVEDDGAVQKSLCAVLGSHGFETIACNSAEQFLDMYEPDRKACLILDLRLPGWDGTQLQDHLNEAGSNLPIIMLTAHGDVPVAVQCLHAGAIDFIEKPANIDRLIEALHLAGGTLFDQAVPSIPKRVVSERLSKLTSREHEVLEHLLGGNLNKEIAGKLGVSLRTVEVHRSRIKEKMQARGIADLIRMIG